MKLFFLVFLTLLIAANSYVAYRLCTLLPYSTSGRALIVSAVVLLVLFFFAAFIIADRVPTIIGTLFYKAGNTWLIALLYLLIIFILLDILRLLHIFPMDWMIKGSITGFCTVTGLVALLLIIGNMLYHNKQRIELDLVIPKAINTDDGTLKVVMISDLHLGYGTGKKELKKWVEKINQEEADIVLITGDIVDSSTKPLIENEAEKIFADIKTRYGTYAVLGNHEYISGIEKSLTFIHMTNVKLLRDEISNIDGLFYVVGRDDRTNASRKELHELIGALDNSLPVILLDHQPYNLKEAEDNMIDLQVSGHTHQGQVWPASTITKAMFEKDHGFIKKGDTNYYVSSGIGIWGGKFRIGTRSEYAVITLRGSNHTKTIDVNH